MAKMLMVLAVVCGIGMIGTSYNLMLGKEPSDWKNHVYSTALIMPLVIYEVCLLMYSIVCLFLYK